jgi:hypothetical protein
VVRHGRDPVRAIQTGIGSVDGEKPKARDHGAAAGVGFGTAAGSAPEASSRQASPFRPAPETAAESRSEPGLSSRANALRRRASGPTKRALAVDKRYADGYIKIQEVYMTGARSGRSRGPLADNG